MIWFASAISVFVAVISALTLLPALISIFHKQIHPKQTKTEFEGDVDTKWSKFVVGKPLAAVLIGLIILVVAAIPINDMRLGIPDDGMKPADTTKIISPISTAASGFPTTNLDHFVSTSPSNSVFVCLG